MKGQASLTQKRADAVLSEVLDRTYPVELTKPGVNAKLYHTLTSNGYDAYAAPRATSSSSTRSINRRSSSPPQSSSNHGVN
jgi:hypothetical protein